MSALGRCAKSNAPKVARKTTKAVRRHPTAVMCSAVSDFVRFPWAASQSVCPPGVGHNPRNQSICGQTASLRAGPCETAICRTFLVIAVHQATIKPSVYSPGTYLVICLLT